MSRVMNVIENEAWDDSESRDQAQPANVEPRFHREAAQLKAPYRFERGEEDPRKAEWSSTLLLVQEACEAIKASEDRVEALESELEAANARYREGSLQMVARLNAAEEEIKAANARAKAFEARAAEAEAWLTRLNQAIVNGFGNSIKRDKGSHLRHG
jgi:predicted S18 family serine protease